MWGIYQDEPTPPPVSLFGRRSSSPTTGQIFLDADPVRTLVAPGGCHGGHSFAEPHLLTEIENQSLRAIDLSDLILMSHLNDFFHANFTFQLPRRREKFLGLDVPDKVGGGIDDRDDSSAKKRAQVEDAFTSTDRTEVCVQTYIMSMGTLHAKRSA